MVNFLCYGSLKVSHVLDFLYLDDVFNIISYIEMFNNIFLYSILYSYIDIIILIYSYIDVFNIYIINICLC